MRSMMGFARHAARLESGERRRSSSFGACGESCVFGRRERGRTRPEGFTDPAYEMQ